MVRTVVSVWVRRRRRVVVAKVVVAASSTGSRRRHWVVTHGAARWRTVWAAVIIVLASRATITVSVRRALAAWAVTSRGWSTAIVSPVEPAVIGSSSRRSRTSAVSWNFGLCLVLISSRSKSDISVSYISDACNLDVLELSTVELLDGCLKVRRVFKLNKSSSSVRQGFQEDVLRRTLCLSHGQFPNRPHPIRIDGQSPLDPALCE